MEKLIQFPLPRYIDFFNDNNKLIKEPICLCYQYEADEKGFGPYGFNTVRAKEILKLGFKETVVWDGEHLKFNKDVSSVGNYSVTFFDSMDFINNQIKLLEEYDNQIKKNILLKKYGKEPKCEIVKPVLKDMIKSKLFDYQDINYLIKNEVSFFLSVSYSPEAGNTIILFDNKKLVELEKICTKLKVIFFNVSSINKLKPW